MKIIPLILLLLALAAQGQTIAPSPAVQFTWTSPASNPTNTVYTVVYGTNSGAYTAGVSGTSNTSPVITNLMRGVTYYFAVAANAPGWLASPNSTEVSYSVSQPQLSAVQGVTVITIVK